MPGAQPQLPWGADPAGPERGAVERGAVERGAVERARRRARPGWRIDERSRRVGLAGVAAARRALAEARQRAGDAA